MQYVIILMNRRQLEKKERKQQKKVAAWEMGETEETRLAVGLKDTRYKMVLLPFHVYNYTHIRHYTHRDMHSI